MSRRALERAVYLSAWIVLPLAGWFWYEQVLDVIELLRLAYG